MGLTPTQYQKIMRDYDQKRSNALRIQEEHLNRIRQNIPEYAELENESASIAIEYGKRILDDPTISLQEMDSRLEAISVCKDSLLRAHGYDPSYVRPVYTCPDCQDTGYINDTKCHCFLQAQIDLLYSQSNIRDLIQTENFDSIRFDYYQGEDLERFKAAVATCHNFVDNFDNQYDNLIFYGKVGTGKSFLSGCIAQALIELGHSVIYFSSPDLFTTMADNAFHRNTDAQSSTSIMDNRDLYECDLLVIDDLGAEMTNQFVCSSLFSCLNERHLRHKSTIISTNLSLEELNDRYSQRIFSRAVGNFNMLLINGPDIRIEKKKTI